MNDKVDYFFAALDNLLVNGVDPVVALEKTIKGYAFVYFGGDPLEEVARAAQVELERIAQGSSKK